VWVKTPHHTTSWKYFQELLYDINVVCTPGAGFGQMGEGYFRLTGFNSRENTIEAMNRISNWI
jgi:LL-diaminopimelate aminotransferase